MRDPLVVALDVTHAQINRTGLGRYAAELWQALQARPGLEMLPLSAFATRPSSRLGQLAQGVVREGLYYPRLAGSRARRRGAALLHLPTPAPARAGGLPLVVTVHDLLPCRHPELFTLQTRAHMRLFMPFVRAATRIVTPSLYTRAEAIELLGVDEDKVVAIPHGLPERFGRREVDREALARELGITGRYVLAAGTLEPRKNLIAALRAFALLAQAVDDVQLVLAGGQGWRNGEFEAELRRSAVADRVCLTGYVSDERLIDLYSAASCFVFPSFAEGFGLPPLEAMACGAPVVASDRAALPEVLGDSALLVDPRDHHALAEQIARVLRDEDLASALRVAGLKRAERFSWPLAAAETERVYREALAAV